MQQDSPGRASCPVCGHRIAFKDMNSHIDMCLRDHEARQRQGSDVAVCTSDSSRVVSPTVSSHGLSYGKQTLLSGFRKREFSTSSSAGHGKKRKLTTTPLSHGSTANTPLPSSTSNIPLLYATTSNTPLPRISTSTTPLPHTSTSTTPLPHAAAASSSVRRAPQSQTSFVAVPLADMVRPATLADYMGQQQVVGENSVLRSAIQSGRIPSLIFWGPPGCGKTTLARILASAAREKVGARFVQLSASCIGVGEVKEAVKVARNDKVMFRRQTVLFIDEIHQFNKLQQDSFLPHIEDGTIILLGATTENPSFKLNSALLSRCQVIVLQKLQPNEVLSILRNALRRLLSVREGGKDEIRHDGDIRSQEPVVVEDDAMVLLSELCDGDARSALNALQTAVEVAKNRLVSASQPMDSNSSAKTSVTALQQVHVTVADAKESIQRSHLLYDRAGEEHYNCISALHKSMRGGHASAALYWLARMLCAGEDPLYVARRVVRFASEDVGLADPGALQLAVSTFHACQAVGMPECEVALAQAVVYMARAPKSVEVYRAYGRAVASIRGHRGPQPCVPLHLRNAPTQLMRDLGYGRGYLYNPDFTEPVEQQYLPDVLQHADFFRN